MTTIACFHSDKGKSKQKLPFILKQMLIDFFAHHKKIPNKSVHHFLEYIQIFHSKGGGTGHPVVGAQTEHLT